MCEVNGTAPDVAGVENQSIVVYICRYEFCKGPARARTDFTLIHISDFHLCRPEAAPPRPRSPTSASSATSAGGSAAAASHDPAILDAARSGS
ncbi:MAG: hypothetical protein MZV70_67225 [Desulfobacterales bacterium]|nr:hypothetical protein [Desulfobacterales bacterium]